MRRLKLSLLIAAVTAVVIAAPVAAAGPPTIIRDEVLIDDSGIPCDGGITFDLLLEARFTLVDHGDVIHVLAVVDGTATASSEITVRIHHRWIDTYDLDAGTWSTNGIAFGAGVTGTTARILDRGRLVRSLDGTELLFIAGSWTPDFDPVVLVCELIDEASSV